MSLCSSNITIGVKEMNLEINVRSNNRLIGSHGQLFDNLLVYKDQR